MIGVPAVWLQLASATHAPRWRATLTDAAGYPLVADLPVTGGQLSRAWDGSPRTSAQVYLPASPQWQLIDQQYLPVGHRLHLQYRIEGDGLADSWVTMADLDVTDSAISRPDDMWTLHAVDRSARIAVDDLARAAVPPVAGEVIVDAVTTLLHRTFPGTQVLATGPVLTQRVPTKYNEDTADGSPWDLITALCAEAQSEVFYDTDRRVRIRPIPTAASAAVDTVDVGEEGSVVGYTVKHEMSINTVAMVYRASNGQVLRRGYAEDRRPYSPSSVQRVGSHVVEGRVIDSDGAPSQAEADAAAAAWLTRQGKPRAAELQHPSRPWLEPGDTVQVSFLGGPTELQVVESVGVDLGHEGLQTTRLRNHDYQMSTEVP